MRPVGAADGGAPGSPCARNERLVPNTDLDRRERCAPAVCRFAGFELDLATLTLFRCGQPVMLSYKSLAVLAYLVTRQGELVSRSELVRAIWPDVRVGAGSLTQAIWEIRKVFDDLASGTDMIQTSRGRGYCFRAPPEPQLQCRAEAFALALETWSGRSLPPMLKTGLLDLESRACSRCSGLMQRSNGAD